ncbi:haloacid dehalogenase type II [Nocardioides coralli]|uniref:haloacid dehalogenase type II n=1 Tax=Nocardioides coralli TaxID=2872154 RepID=UPI001CA42106|nr:haloacid dehalogenase type II [Nocardioides coralli]QZY29065.1 haloacid dehalogenase type II [Nocardioides coralli]
MALPAHDTLAFDVYGTLIDTSGVVEQLTEVVGDRAGDFSERWRTTQLGYSWRRALMKDYVDFGVCTAQALDHTAATMAVDLTEDQRAHLLAAYGALPAFPDTAPALRQLSEAGSRLVAFSNGPATAVIGLLDAAGIGDLVSDVVSADDISTFKPDPAVYHHLLERCATEAQRAVVVSSNAFDVIGAQGAGLGSVWVRRSEAVAWDPWDVEPDLTVGALTDLVDG